MTFYSPIIRDEQAAFGFVQSQGRNIEAEIYRRRYPTFNYAEHVPVVTEGNPWAIGTQFRVTDTSGRAKIISGKARDIPFSKTTREQHSHDFVMVGAGWEWSLEETEQGQLYNINVVQDDAMAAADNTERLLYDMAMTGSDEVNWTGLVNDANVQRVDAATVGGGTAWGDNKDADDMVADVNLALETVRSNSNEVEWADTVRLPPTAFRAAATRRLTDSGGTISALQYLRMNNIYTAETGQPLNIAPLRDLADAGVGERGRLVAYRMDRQVLRYHLPMPRRVLPVHRVGLMAYQQGLIARTGGLEIRLPGAMAYVDGVSAEPS